MKSGRLLRNRGLFLCPPKTIGGHKKIMIYVITFKFKRQTKFFEDLELFRLVWIFKKCRTFCHYFLGEPNWFSELFQTMRSFYFAKMFFAAGKSLKTKPATKRLKKLFWKTRFLQITCAGSPQIFEFRRLWFLK